MIKLSKEGMSKRYSQKAESLAQNSQPTCECKGNVLEGNEKCYSSEPTNGEKVKQPYS